MTCAYSPLYLLIQLRAVEVSKVCLSTGLSSANIQVSSAWFLLYPRHWAHIIEKERRGGGKDGLRNEMDGWMDVKKEGRRTERKERWKRELGRKCSERKKPGSGLWTPSLLFFLYHTQWWSKVNILVAQLCLTLCDPMNCSPPGSSVHGILPARTLEWLAIPFSKGSSQPRDQTQVSCIVGDWNTFLTVQNPGRFFTVWTTGEAHHTWCTILNLHFF